MIYHFQDTETGEIVELHYRMKDAPPLDSIVTDGARKLKRVVSPVTEVNGSLMDDTTYPMAPISLGFVPGCRQDKHGHAIIESKHHARELRAKGLIFRDERE